jgi:hypothetical protein
MAHFFAFKDSYILELILSRQALHLKRLTFLLAVLTILPVSAGLYLVQEEQYLVFGSSISTMPANGIGSII